MDLRRKNQRRKYFQTGVNDRLQEWEYKQQYMNALNNSPEARIQQMEAQLPGLYQQPQQVLPDTAPINNVQLNSPFNSQAVYAPTLSQYMGSTVPLEAGIGALNREYDNYFESTAPTIKIGDALDPDIKLRDSKNKEYQDRIYSLSRTEGMSPAQRMRSLKKIKEDYQNDPIIRGIQESLNSRRAYQGLLKDSDISSEEKSALLRIQDNMYANAGGLGNTPNELGAYNIYSGRDIAKYVDVDKRVNDVIKGWAADTFGSDHTIETLNGMYQVKNSSGQLIKTIPYSEVANLVAERLQDDPLTISYMKQNALVDAFMSGKDYTDPSLIGNYLVNRIKRASDFGGTKASFKEQRVKSGRELTADPWMMKQAGWGREDRNNPNLRPLSTTRGATTRQRDTLPDQITGLIKQGTKEDFVKNRTGLTPQFDATLQGEGLDMSTIRPDSFTKSDGTVVKYGDKEFNSLYDQYKAAQQSYDGAANNIVDAGKKLETENEIFAQLVAQERTKQRLAGNNNLFGSEALGMNSPIPNISDNDVYTNAYNKLKAGLGNNTQYDNVLIFNTPERINEVKKVLQSQALFNQTDPESKLPLKTVLDQQAKNYTITEKDGKSRNARNFGDIINNGLVGATWNPNTASYEVTVEGGQVFNVPGTLEQQAEAKLFNDAANTFWKNGGNSTPSEFILGDIQQPVIINNGVDENGNIQTFVKPVPGKFGNLDNFYTRFAQIAHPDPTKSYDPVALKNHVQKYGGLPLDLYQQAYRNGNTTLGTFQNKVSWGGEMKVLDRNNQGN